MGVKKKWDKKSEKTWGKKVYGKNIFSFSFYKKVGYNYVNICTFLKKLKWGGVCGGWGGRGVRGGRGLWVIGWAMDGGGEGINRIS